MFTGKERDFLDSQPLARIATVSRDGQPDVAPVGFEFDGEFLYVGGYDLERTRKFKNIQTNTKVALVVDDLVSMDPWTPRGIRVYGVAEVASRESYAGTGKYMRIEPTRKWSWGIDGPG